VFRCRRTLVGRAAQPEQKSLLGNAHWQRFVNVFYPTLCKTPDAPLQNELLCWTFVHFLHKISAKILRV